MNKMTRTDLLESALDRIQAKWPGVDRAAEAKSMADWSDRRLATEYMPDGTPDSYYEEAAKVYGDDDIGYDSADDGGLVGSI